MRSIGLELLKSGNVFGYWKNLFLTVTFSHQEWVIVYIVCKLYPPQCFVLRPKKKYVSNKRCDKSRIKYLTKRCETKSMAKLHLKTVKKFDPVPKISY